MGFINREDVVAWFGHGKLICDDCIGDMDTDEMEPYTEDTFSDDVIAKCDECGKRLH